MNKYWIIYHPFPFKHNRSHLPLDADMPHYAALVEAEDITDASVKFTRDFVKKDATLLFTIRNVIEA